MNKNKIFSMILIAIILLLHCSAIFATVVDADNGKMKYYKKDYGLFDIKGYVNGELQSTTFLDGGYQSKLKVNNNEEEEIRFYTNGEQAIDGIAWDVDCSFINNGRYVKVTYTLTNNNEQTSTISLGTYVDVQIAGDDYATIERFENSNGLKLYNKNKNIQFSFYGKSVAGTTDIDNLWIGKYPNHRENCFNNNSTNKIESQDSAFTFSWVNRTIEAGETKKYSVIIGMGEVSNAPKIELDKDQGRCFSQDSVVINGTITDLDANSKALLYYVVDNGEEKYLEEKSLTNNKLNFNLDITSENLVTGTHKIKLWAIDESGNPSEILEKNILITNLKAPVLNMSEEWAKQTIKFTITDEENDEEDVLKYQFKIGNGEWQDVELNEETVALENTGTTVVMAKVVGKETDEQSSIVSKTAKLDKNGPIISALEQNGKIIIDVTDEHSGLNNVKFLLNSEKELTGEEEFKDYEEPIDCSILEAGDLYLHIISTDKLGNESAFLKEYKEPVSMKIVTQDKFTDKNPTYKLTDENNNAQDGYTYQIKVNDNEWKDIELGTEYTIDKPVLGKNKITTRTKDALGRISNEVKAETIYEEAAKDTTIADKILPNTGIEKIIVGLTIILILGTVGYIKYRKLKFIK